MISLDHFNLRFPNSNNHNKFLDLKKKKPQKQNPTTPKPSTRSKPRQDPRVMAMGTGAVAYSFISPQPPSGSGWEREAPPSGDTELSGLLGVRAVSPPLGSVQKCSPLLASVCSLELLSFQ